MIFVTHRDRFISYHAVQEFNQGVYDYIIATDEGGPGVEYDTEDEEDAEEDEEEECRSWNIFSATRH